MTQEQIEKVIIEALKEVQEMSGRKWDDLNVTDKPHNDLDGFDSLCSIETTVFVEAKLGISSLNLISLFFSDDRKQVFSIEESARRILEITQRRKAK